MPIKSGTSGNSLGTSISASEIDNGAITNAQISATAAIVYTKLTVTGAIVNADLTPNTLANSSHATSLQHWDFIAEVNPSFTSTTGFDITQLDGTTYEKYMLTIKTSTTSATVLNLRINDREGAAPYENYGVTGTTAYQNQTQSMTGGTSNVFSGTVFMAGQAIDDGTTRWVIYTGPLFASGANSYFVAGRGTLASIYVTTVTLFANAGNMAGSIQLYGLRKR